MMMEMAVMAYYLLEVEVTPEVKQVHPEAAALVLSGAAALGA